MQQTLTLDKLGPNSKGKEHKKIRNHAVASKNTCPEYQDLTRATKKKKKAVVINLWMARIRRYKDRLRDQKYIMVVKGCRWSNKCYLDTAD